MGDAAADCGKNQTQQLRPYVKIHKNVIYESKRNAFIFINNKPYVSLRGFYLTFNIMTEWEKGNRKKWFIFIHLTIELIHLINFSIIVYLHWLLFGANYVRIIETFIHVKKEKFEEMCAYGPDVFTYN